MQSSSIITVISFRSFEGQKTKATPSGMPSLRPCSPPRLQVATAAPSWHTQFPAWCWAALRLRTRCSVTHVLTTHTPRQHCSTSMSSFSSRGTTSGCCAECCCASMFPWGHFSGSYSQQWHLWDHVVIFHSLPRPCSNPLPKRLHRPTATASAISLHEGGEGVKPSTDRSLPKWLQWLGLNSQG